MWPVKLFSQLFDNVTLFTGEKKRSEQISLEIVSWGIYYSVLPNKGSTINLAYIPQHAKSLQCQHWRNHTAFELGL
jgi:hypothetical protein